jgi:MoaA/NifB/PqqE/SkfB family radical SAM enzyme
MKYWDYIREYEINDEWRRNLSDEYIEYRRLFDLAKKGKYESKFPLSVEIEASYYCNLKCPLCPRVPASHEKEDKHMSMGLYNQIIEESKQYGLKALLMDHEAESLMNPNFIEMLKIAKNSGIIDIWLHTNANLLTRQTSEDLIDNGITKINFSIDSISEDTYSIVREGGEFNNCISNVLEFLEIKNKKNAKHVRTRVSFVVSDINKHEKEGFFNFWKDQKELNLITFQHAFDFSGFESPDNDMSLSDDQLTNKYSNAPEFFCSQPWEMPIINVDGDVSPCGSPVRSHNSDFFLGNLLQGDTIQSCFNGEKMKKLRSLHLRNQWYKNPMCRVCVNSKNAEVSV